MDEDLQKLLRDVASGKVTPEAAAARLGQPESEPGEQPATSIAIRVGAVRLSVVADPDVADAVTTGPVSRTRQGDTLLITTDSQDQPDDAEPPRSALVSWISQMANRVGANVEVRVNPDLPLRVLLVGGALDLVGTRAGVSVGVEAGSATLTGGSGPMRLDVTSGSGRVDWTFTGNSQLGVDMGSLAITVRADSDAQVTAECSMGQAVIKSPAGIIKAGGDLPAGPVAVGSGAGSVKVSARMGSAQLAIG